MKQVRESSALCTSYLCCAAAPWTDSSTQKLQNQLHSRSIGVDPERASSNRGFANAPLHANQRIVLRRRTTMAPRAFAQDGIVRHCRC